MINSVFPTPLYVTKVLADFSKLRKDKRFIYNDQEHNNEVRILEDYPDIKATVLNIFHKFTCELYGPYQKFVMTTSWLTETKKGGKIRPHNHKNCMFSGVLYYDKTYSDDVVPLKLTRPDAFTASGFHVDFKHTQRPEFASNTTIIQPEYGLICFWTSNLIHYTEPSLSSKARHSLAFNFVPTGTFGSVDSTLNTKWFDE